MDDDYSEPGGVPYRLPDGMIVYVHWPGLRPLGGSYETPFSGTPASER